LHQPTEEEIQDYLEQCKANYRQHGKVDRIIGKEEKETLTKLGVRISDALEYILQQTENISSKNYYRGPSPDHNNPNEDPPTVWEFGIPMDDEPDIYLKMKIRENKDDLLFMSFHFAKHEIIYPYKVPRT